MNQNVSQGKISLDGFEDSLVARLAADFRFTGEYLQNVPLVVGRHLFVQDMPATDTLVADAKAQGVTDYDPEREPVISVFTVTNQAVAPTISRGGRHEWQLRITLRLGTVMEECKARLEELVEYMTLQLPGVYISRYAIKGVILTARPNAFQIEDSDQAYCDVQLRLFAVPRVTA